MKLGITDQGFRRLAQQDNAQVFEIFDQVKSKFPEDLDSWCYEFSNEFLTALRAEGLPAELRRRMLPGEGGGHWTVVVNGVEYDPTIGCWKEDRPVGAECGKLYVVDDDSPHQDWPEEW